MTNVIGVVVAPKVSQYMRCLNTGFDYTCVIWLLFWIVVLDTSNTVVVHCTVSAFRIVCVVRSSVITGALGACAMCFRDHWIGASCVEVVDVSEAGTEQASGEFSPPFIPFQSGLSGLRRVCESLWWYSLG